MLRRWNDMWADFDRGFAWMEAIRHQMESASEGAGSDLRASRGFPGVNLYDAGEEFIVRAEVPGLSEKDVNVTVNQDVLTVSGEKKNDSPEGYAVHRRERLPTRFSRSFSFPSAVDTEKVKATVRAGVLTVRLTKAAETKPRQIAVSAE